MTTVIKHLNIRHIKIENLFGIYTYSIPINDIDISKLLILYGDNGAGKTTILQIIFNLLSYENAQGHKTELANTKFKKISITLSNDYIISAERKESLIGGYELSLTTNETTHVVPCNALKQNNLYSINTEISGNEQISDFLSLLKNINLSIHYLSDDRKVKSNISIVLNEHEDQLSISGFPIDMMNDIRSNRDKIFSLSDIYLKDAIRRVEEWFRDQTLLGNSIGQESINSIYFNLIEKLLDDSEIQPSSKQLKITKEEILESLKQLSARNEKFLKYKLTADYNLDKYIQIIKKTSTSKLEIVDNTLKPYIDGIEKKLNAIEDTKNIIDIFITTLNDFYSGKKLEFSIDEGLKIVSTFKKNEYLSPTMLSSGEKQLLLLFCNTITAREHASIFIIDEPELSLNVKWQRKLINALLSFAKNSSIQFILASHSIELLTQYKSNVCKLENVKEL